MVRHTNAIRVVSERIKRSLEQLKVTADVSVVPIQADLLSFIEAGKNRHYDQVKGINFLYVGRFSSEKNLPLLVRSFSEVSVEFSNARLTLLGSGPAEPDIRSLIKELKLEQLVKVKPWSNNVATEMTKHDVFCLSSNHEGWGMVLLEAAATAMPIITTDVGCVGEVVFDKQNGLVVPVGDQMTYIEAMRFYCLKPELVQKFGQAGKEIAAQYSVSEEDFVSQIVASFPSCRS